MVCPSQRHIGCLWHGVAKPLIRQGNAILGAIDEKHGGEPGKIAVRQDRIWWSSQHRRQS